MCGPFKRRCGPKASHAHRSYRVAATVSQQMFSCASIDSTAAGPQGMQLDGIMHASETQPTGSSSSAAPGQDGPHFVQQRGRDMGAASTVSPFGLEQIPEGPAPEPSQQPFGPENQEMLHADGPWVASLRQDVDMRSPLPDALLTSAVILERGPAPVAAARIVPKGIGPRTQQPDFSH